MDKISAIDYINQMFPSESSLSGVEPLMQKIHGEIRRVDSEILVAVRRQSDSGAKAKQDLSAATNAVQELIHKIREIKSKADQSESMVQDICRDIKKLDFAKKNITATITALHRLTMLVSAVEQLQLTASKRQYKEAAAQLEAVNQLCSTHFEAYSDVPRITELKERFKNIKSVLKSHILADFSTLGKGKEGEDSNFLQQLSDSCLVVDALEPSVREELVNTFCSKELTSYQQIFEGAELAKLDKTERRYAWIKRRLRSNEDVWKIFPQSWNVEYLLCIRFCKLTRIQLTSILKEKPDVGALLLALQRTLEFEGELAERYSVHTNRDIRKKYEEKLVENRRTENYISGENHRDVQHMPSPGFNFNGIISSCFEPHMTVYVELEEKTLMENMEKLVQEETWDVEEGSQTNILSSSMQVFLMIRKSLKRCSALSKNQTLLNLFGVFQRVLKSYASKLVSRLPKGGIGVVTAAGAMDGSLKGCDRNESVCYIVNTGEYCQNTSAELAESIAKIIDPHFVVNIEMSHVQDEFSSVVTRALVTLVHGIEARVDIEMGAMTRLQWGALEGVGDQSEYVNGINSILSSSIPVIGTLLSPIYFQFFLDKLASFLCPHFYANIFKCRHISEMGAQQMLLDTQAVKTILLDIPSLGKQVGKTGSYSKFVSQEMGKAEALLKVILSPLESVADTYYALLPEGTPAEFQRILELKGLKKGEQQSILDDFSKVGTGTSHVSIVDHCLVSPSPVISNVSVIASREDVLTRAAALGRGAATTGFKRFLALTEAAKDHKEGTFRKLFST